MLPDIEIIRSLAKQDRIAFKKHSILRMRQRTILADDVKFALLNGRFIEQYPTDRPLPSGLLLGQTEHGRILHIVIACDEIEQMLWLITVYEPNLNDWEDGFERRRKL
jgi:hypothetical protein